MRTEEIIEDPSRSAVDRAGVLDRFSRLMRTVESEIVPRLMLVRRSSTQRLVASTEAVRVADTEEVAELVRLLLSHDPTIAIAFVESVRERGVSPPDIYLELLAPAARRLGVMWEDDACDFMQVTFGLCRLHQVLHRMNAEFLPDASSSQQLMTRRALLVCLPGEQHTFGVVIAGQFLRRDGWDVWNEFPANNDELLGTLRNNSFNIIGLSIGSEARLDELVAVVKAVRRASRNRSICVMVGGPMLVSNPEIASAVGADVSAADAREAAEWVRNRFPSLVSSG
jgi:MerR family transcriptional regulator, light-induced transcriptional regulator